MVGTGVDVQEFAILWLEVGLTGSFRVVLGLVKLVGYGHVHLDLDSCQVDMIVFVSHDEVLVAVMPKQWMSLHLDKLVLTRGGISFSVVLETLEVIQLHWNDRASLWVLDLECSIEDADLQPVVTIKLRNQITCLIAQGEFLRVAREHDLRDVDTEELSLLRLAQTVKQNVVDCSFLATDDGFAAILVQEHRLVLHVDLLLQLQVALAEDENLAFECHIDVTRGAHG